MTSFEKNEKHCFLAFKILTNYPLSNSLQLLFETYLIFMCNFYHFRQMFPLASKRSLLKLNSQYHNPILRSSLAKRVYPYNTTALHFVVIRFLFSTPPCCIRKTIICLPSAFNTTSYQFFPNNLTSTHLETIYYIACDDDDDDKPTTTTTTNNNNKQILRARGTTPLRKKLFAMQAYS